MSIDTGLYLSNRWDLDDLKDVIENHLGCPVEIKSTTDSMPSYHIFNFTYKNEYRSLNVHHATMTPLGRFILITLKQTYGHASEILKAIGEVLGGLYYDNDCDMNLEWITGKLDENDKLSYHIKHAITENKAETLLDVAKSIRKWNKRVCKNSNLQDDSTKLIGNSKFGLEE
jgi:hypothetical protein